MRAGTVAVATDVGAWRVLRPVLAELERRGRPCQIMLAGPASSIACQDGVPHQRFSGETVAERAREGLAAEPTALLLGTSVQPVVERTLTAQSRRRQPPIPTLAVLDAMLFVERRFGQDLAELADVVACPDPETVQRLEAAGAAPERVIATGNPTLEEIGLTAASPPPAVSPERPTDVLFVSSPVEDMRRRGTEFAIDERQGGQKPVRRAGRLRAGAALTVRRSQSPIVFAHRARP